MFGIVPREPIDYLVMGHVTEDVMPTGQRLGGTAAYAALTARALGLRVGVITSAGASTNMNTLQGISIVNVPAPRSTTFEASTTTAGRRLTIHGQASAITPAHVPETWRRTSIVHLGPVAQELMPECAEIFASAMLGITPQGWMREWDAVGNITACNWDSAEKLLPKTGAVVISREDVEGNQDAIEEMSHRTRVLAVTEGAAGSVLYWNGDGRRFRAPDVREVDDVGAGDVFAAALFTRLYMTRDPWEAARFATLLAARSVTREGLESIPTGREIERCTVEVLG
jgi:sugar/nucleoside kinase (ribokinase family)